MLCFLCQRELTASVTGTLMRYSCAHCNVHHLESLDETTDPADVLNTLKQIIRKGVPRDGTTQ